MSQNDPARAGLHGRYSAKRNTRPITRMRLGRISVNVVLGVIVAVWLLPTFMLVISSLRPVGDMMTSGWWNALLHPGRFTLGNYRLVLASKGIGLSFINSLIITIPSTILPILLGALAAYPLSFGKFPGRKLIFIILIAMQIVPLQVVLIPVLLLLMGLHLNGTFAGVWLTHTAFGLPLCIFIFRNFFAQIPYSLIEAAEIDGANNLQVFFKLIGPMAKPTFASMAIFQFLWVWNDMLVALFVLNNNALNPMTVKLASLLGSLDAGWEIMTPAALLSMLLPLTIFLAFQKYYVKGILAGAVKG